jgi:hypothetical protein
MVMVLPPIQLINRKSALKIVPIHQFSGLKLGQYSVDGRETYLLSLLQQDFVDIFGTYVLIAAVFQNFEDFHPWNRNLKASLSYLFILQRILSFVVCLDYADVQHMRKQALVP